jgi:branched-chain amino acid transport system substrate-binding protein
MYAAMLAAEAAKTAQDIHGTTAITPAMMRDGMENLEMTEEKMAALGLPKFGPEFKVSCENHGGNGYGAVAQWDATAGEWSLITDYFQSDQEVLAPLVEEDSAAYAAENGIEPGC